MQEITQNKNYNDAYDFSDIFRCMNNNINIFASFEKNSAKTGNISYKNQYISRLLSYIKVYYKKVIQTAPVLMAAKLPNRTLVSAAVFFMLCTCFIDPYYQNRLNLGQSAMPRIIVIRVPSKEIQVAKTTNTKKTKAEIQKTKSGSGRKKNTTQYAKTKNSYEYEPVTGSLTPRIIKTIQRTNPSIPDHLAAEYASYIMEASLMFKLHPAIITGVMLAESTANRTALNKSGAVGLMQVMWRVHKKSLIKKFPDIDCHDDMFNARNNILAGAWILKGYIERTGSIQRGLARYLGGSSGSYYRKVMKFARASGYVG